jgi:hypothetical protein
MMEIILHAELVDMIDEVILLVISILCFTFPAHYIQGERFIVTPSDMRMNETKQAILFAHCLTLTDTYGIFVLMKYCNFIDCVEYKISNLRFTSRY